MIKNGTWYPDISEKQSKLLEMCREQNSRMKSILVCGPKFSSKCVSPDTLIYTDSGPIPIRLLGSAGEDCFSPVNFRVASLAAGNHAIGMARATHFYNSGKNRKAFVMSTYSGYELRCSPAHPLWSECDGDIRFRTSNEIHELMAGGKDVWLPMARDHTAGWPTEFKTVTFDWCPGQLRRTVEAGKRIEEAKRKGAKTTTEIIKASGCCNSSVHIHRHGSKTPKRLTVVIDDEMAYVLGLMVGDGGYSPAVTKSHGVTFTTGDLVIANFFDAFLKARFPDSSLSTVINKCNYRVRSSAFRAFLKHIGMDGVFSHQKTIPDCIWGSPKSAMVAFIQGLFDTDGTVDSSGRAAYCSTSRQLCKDVQSILLSLGVRSRRNFKANDYQGAWMLNALAEDDFELKVGFRLERKQQLALQRRKASMARWRGAMSCYPPSLWPVLRTIWNNRKLKGVQKFSRAVHKKTTTGIMRRSCALSPRNIAPFLKLAGDESNPKFLDYSIGGGVWWDHITSCDPTECDLLDLSVNSTHNFIGNGFINHNTVACANAIVDHCWNTEHANVAIIVPSITVGEDGGFWELLTETIIPEWIEGDFGLDWAMEGKRLGTPRQKGTTKKLFCVLKNRFGGKSKIQLNSIKQESEVELNFFGRYFSFLYVSEAALVLRHMKSYTTLLSCFRVKGVPEEKYVLLLDTNPSDEGEDSWFYKEWYVMRNSHPDTLTESEKIRQKYLRLLEIHLDDNPYLSDERKAKIRADYNDDPDLKARYVDGQWKKAKSGALFADVFKPALHVLGDSSGDDPELWVPETDVTELMTGWDFGPANPAVVFCEEFTFDFGDIGDDEGAEVGEAPGKKVFKFFDEICFLESELSLGDFTELVCDKMDFWESVVGHPVKWHAYSDRSAFDMRESISNLYQYQEVWRASEGRIDLIAVDKGKGSVPQRIRLWRKLLLQQRLLFSAERCPKLIEMNQALPAGKEGQPIARGTPHRHPFDAATYLVTRRAWQELSYNILLLRNMNRPTARVISVPL